MRGPTAKLQVSLESERYDLKVSLEIGPTGYAERENARRNVKALVAK
jgi:hypothetical protein